MVQIQLEPASFSFRDATRVVWRQKWSAVSLYIGVLVIAGAYCFFWPPSYQANVQLLIKHDREDPVVSSDQNSIRTLVKPAVTEEDLNSEEAILKSRAVLERTVADTAFDKVPEHWLVRFLSAPLVQLSLLYQDYHHQAGPSPAERAIDKLRGKLNVIVEKKSSIIQVELRAGSREQAKTMLDALIRNYIAQHLAAHRSANAQSVFLAEAERRAQELAEVEQRIEKVSLGGTSGSVALERDVVLKQAADFESEWRKAAAMSREKQAKVNTEEEELTSLPERVVTEDRIVPNQTAIGDLSNQLLSLQLKSNELSSKYQPESRLVKQADADRQRAEDMLRAQTEHPMHEQTRALNRVFESVQQNLLVDRALLKGSSNLEHSMLLSYDNLQRRLEKTNRAASEIQALDRERRALEEAYQLYRKRYEEARMEDQMNLNQVVNVSAIEPVYADSDPVKPNAKLTLKLVAAAGLLAALLLAFVREALENPINDTRHVESLIGAPVFAAIPSREFPWRTLSREAANIEGRSGT
jgi:uncharacterized protein involved in exopolysaccharide biosynthesis